MLEGTRGSPSAPTKIASKSRESIVKPSTGIVVPSSRYRSADQLNSVNATSAPVAFTTDTACAITSFPIPSPGTTAMRLVAFTLETISENLFHHGGGPCCHSEQHVFGGEESVQNCCKGKVAP